MILVGLGKSGTSIAVTLNTQSVFTVKACRHGRAHRPEKAYGDFRMMPTILVIDPDVAHRSHFQAVLAEIGVAGDFYENLEQLPSEFDIAAYPAAVIDLDRTKRPKQLLDSWRQNSKTIRLIGLSRETDGWPLALGLLGALVAFLAHGLFDNPTSFIRPSVILWTLLGLQAAFWLYLREQQGGGASTGQESSG